MIFMIFEIAINCFQAALMLMYVKLCFPFPKKNAVADGLVLAACAGHLTLLLFFDPPSAVELGVFLYPLVYALLFSSEKRISIFYWCAILLLICNAISILTYPIFDLLPSLFQFEYPSHLVKRVLCILTTNLLLFITLLLVIRIKKDCSSASRLSYLAFLLMLTFIFFTEESIWALFNRFGSRVSPLPFLIIYGSLTLLTLLIVFLFRTVSIDADRTNQYRAEIAVLNLSHKHQTELYQMYEALNQMQHDYKHHLQSLKALVANSSESAAKSYLNTIAHDTETEEVLVTGSPEIDALLTAKRRTMKTKHIAFQYSPYPLAQLPIAAPDICAIVGNLLDNAIEGISRMAVPPPSPHIHLSFSRSWNMFYIYCENPCDPNTVIRTSNGFVSSKEQGPAALHGLGLRSIQRITSRAEGRAEFEVKNGVFYAKVVLPYLNIQPPAQHKTDTSAREAQEPRSPHAAND